MRLWPRCLDPAARHNEPESQRGRRGSFVLQRVSPLGDDLMGEARAARRDPVHRRAGAAVCLLSLWRAAGPRDARLVGNADAELIDLRIALAQSFQCQLRLTGRQRPTYSWQP